MAIRPSLRWTLLATLAASAGALLTSRAPAPAIKPDSEPGSGLTRASPAPTRSPASRETPTAGLQPVVRLAEARFDPFAGVMPPPAAPAPQTSAVSPPPPAPPSPPPLLVRFAGRLTDADGQETVFLAGTDGTPIPIKQGATLEAGYVVESVTASSATLVYPPSGTHVGVPLEPAPDSSSR